MRQAQNHPSLGWAMADQPPAVPMRILAMPSLSSASMPAAGKTGCACLETTVRRCEPACGGGCVGAPAGAAGHGHAGADASASAVPPPPGARALLHKQDTGDQPCSRSSRPAAPAPQQQALTTSSGRGRGVQSGHVHGRLLEEGGGISGEGHVHRGAGEALGGSRAGGQGGSQCGVTRGARSVAGGQLSQRVWAGQRHLRPWAAGSESAGRRTLCRRMCGMCVVLQAGRNCL